MDPGVKQGGRQVLAAAIQLERAPSFGYYQLSLGYRQVGRVVDADATVRAFFFSSRRRHTRFDCDWSSDVCSSDLAGDLGVFGGELIHRVNDFNRACGRSADEWQQRQVGLWMRSERDRPGWFGRCGDRKSVV